MWLFRPQITVAILTLLSFSRVAAATDSALEERVSRIPVNVYVYCSTLFGVSADRKPTQTQLTSLLECADHVNPESGNSKPLPFEGDHNTRYGKGVK